MTLKEEIIEDEDQRGTLLKVCRTELRRMIGERIPRRGMKKLLKVSELQKKEPFPYRDDEKDRYLKEYGWRNYMKKYLKETQELSKDVKDWFHAYFRNCKL